MGNNRDCGTTSAKPSSTLPIQYLPKTISAKQKYGQNLSIWTNSPVRVDFLLEVELLALTFATGIEDATTFPDFFCYTSNQTGNTISLAIGAAGIRFPNFFMSNVAFSLGIFIIGCWAMGQTGSYVGPTRRLWVLISSFIQTAMVFAAAAMLQSLPMQSTGQITWSVLALMAFSGGGQVAMARGLKIPEISTAMASSAFVDLLVDPNLYATHNRSRNRRVAFLLSMFFGALTGAYAHQNSKLGSSGALMISGIVKLIVTVGLALNKSEDGQE